MSSRTPGSLQPGSPIGREEEQMIVLEVFFPEDLATTQGEEQSSIDLWNGLALSFFLESLWKGASLFNGRKFKIIAYRVADRGANEGREWIGQGTYEVVDRQLITHDEAGELIDIIAAAWREMLRRIGQHRR
jgi:hypothetical protein